MKTAISSAFVALLATITVAIPFPEPIPGAAVDFLRIQAINARDPAPKTKDGAALPTCSSANGKIQCLGGVIKPRAAAAKKNKPSTTSTTTTLPDEPSLPTCASANGKIHCLAAAIEERGADAKKSKSMSTTSAVATTPTDIPVLPSCSASGVVRCQENSLSPRDDAAKSKRKTKKKAEASSTTTSPVASTSSLDPALLPSCDLNDAGFICLAITARAADAKKKTPITTSTTTTAAPVTLITPVCPVGGTAGCVHIPIPISALPTSSVSKREAQVLAERLAPAPTTLSTSVVTRPPSGPIKLTPLMMLQREEGEGQAALADLGQRDVHLEKRILPGNCLAPGCTKAAVPTCKAGRPCPQ